MGRVYQFVKIKSEAPNAQRVLCGFMRQRAGSIPHSSGSSRLALESSLLRKYTDKWFDTTQLASPNDEGTRYYTPIPFTFQDFKKFLHAFNFDIPL